MQIASKSSAHGGLDAYAPQLGSRRGTRIMADGCGASFPHLRGGDGGSQLALLQGKECECSGAARSTDGVGGMGWAGRVASGHAAVGMRRWIDSDAGRPADSRTRTGHQHRYAYAGSANIHAHADACTHRGAWRRPRRRRLRYRGYRQRHPLGGSVRCVHRGRAVLHPH